MSRQKIGRHIASIVYDLEREASLSEKTLARDKNKRMEKLKKIDSAKIAEEIVEMIERSK